MKSYFHLYNQERKHQRFDYQTQQKAINGVHLIRVGGDITTNGTGLFRKQKY
ncbi:MAG: hypothetical protein ACO1OF_02405 [Adhaeribacter sp.]